MKEPPRGGRSDKRSREHDAHTGQPAIDEKLTDAPGGLETTMDHLIAAALGILCGVTLSWLVEKV